MLPNDTLRQIAEHKYSQPTNPTWPVTTLSLSRNLSMAKFVPSLSKEQRIELLEAIVSHFHEIEGEEFHVLLIKDLPIWQKELLLEHFSFTHDPLDSLEGEALIVNARGDICIGVNFQDHLILHAIDFQNNPEKTLERLIQLDCSLHDRLAFAYSTDFGFLTLNPEHCGTGLKVRCYLHLPALLHTQEFFSLIPAEENLSFSPLVPDISGYIGDIVVLTNRHSLGVTEEQILSTLRIWVTKLQTAEHAAKTKLAEQESAEWKNQILRALGLLTHSYSLDLQETLNALSKIQFGLHAQWLSGASNHPIWIPLFWQVRRGHLSLYQQPEDQKSLDQAVIGELRARVVKDIISVLQN